jgi:hypothetical protein
VICQYYVGGGYGALLAPPEGATRAAVMIDQAIGREDSGHEVASGRPSTVRGEQFGTARPWSGGAELE